VYTRVQSPLAICGNGTPQSSSKFRKDWHPIGYDHTYKTINVGHT